MGLRGRNVGDEFQIQKVCGLGVYIWAHTGWCTGGGPFEISSLVCVHCHTAGVQTRYGGVPVFLPAFAGAMHRHTE